MGRRVDVDDLVDAAAIADRLGLSDGQVIHTWRRRHSDFPQPVVSFSRAHVWIWADVQEWLTRTGRR